MKKIRYLLLCGLLTLYIPKVYALNFNISAASDVVVKSGEKVEIAVGIDNITGTTDGVSVCSMNILFDKNIELETSIRTLNSWTMTLGSMYLFDTGTPVLNKSDMFIIPVIVSGEGSIKLNNILCSDGVEEVSINDKEINFSIKKEEHKNEVNEGNINKPNSSTGNNNVTDTNENNQDDLDNVKSNCNLSDIELSEGSIEFDPNVTEYEVKIKDFKNFKVTPRLENPESSSYVIDKNFTDDGGNVVITVNGSDGDMKVYTIYTQLEDINIKEKSPKDNNYVPIFIVIIAALIIINLIRIIIKVSKKKEQK